MIRVVIAGIAGDYEPEREPGVTCLIRQTGSAAQFTLRAGRLLPIRIRSLHGGIDGLRISSLLFWVSGVAK